jgi:hypothetical protein
MKSNKNVRLGSAIISKPKTMLTKSSLQGFTEEGYFLSLKMADLSIKKMAAQQLIVLQALLRLFVHVVVEIGRANVVDFEMGINERYDRLSSGFWNMDKDKRFCLDLKRGGKKPHT